MGSGFYHVSAILLLTCHLLWVGWVVFGALLTRGRPLLRNLHIASLFYSIFIEVTPWPPCPLTILEQEFRDRAGVNSYRGSFIFHYLEATVYPHVSVPVLVICALAVCGFNLAVYVHRYRRKRFSDWGAKGSQPNAV